MSRAFRRLTNPAHILDKLPAILSVVWDGPRRERINVLHNLGHNTRAPSFLGGSRAPHRWPTVSMFVDPRCRRVSTPAPTKARRLLHYVLRIRRTVHRVCSSGAVPSLEGVRWVFHPQGDTDSFLTSYYVPGSRP